MTVRLQLQLNEYADVVGRRLADWGAADILGRLWAHDHTIWSAEPVPEITDRLGWLTLPGRLAELIDDLEAFGAELRAGAVADVVVLGMGGSSLAPEVFAKTFGSAPGAPQLHVLDSTHPAAVQAMADRVDLAETLFIVASKSGTTIEPLSFLEYFWARVSEVSEEPGAHFVATTDPGSQLEALATDRRFRRIFLAPPDVGGRFSALTEFGLVPAAAIGTDLRALAASAATAETESAATAMVAASPGCRLGAALGELAMAGRDKVTFLTSREIDALPAWIEQLIAESTGKDDRGIVPVGGESLGSASVYGDDRFFIVMTTADSPELDLGDLDGHPIAHITLPSVTDIAAAMYIFEVATALAGAVIGIQPFNQPDVQHAKELARDAMAGKLDVSEVSKIDATQPDLEDHIRAWSGTIVPGDYVGIHAFVEPTAATKTILEAARHAVRDGRRVATTLDFGPRFLHSTGQLHKGGPNSGVFLEIVDNPEPQLPVPGTDYDFGRLITAQSTGDHLALRRRGRRVLLVDIGRGGSEAMVRVADAVRAAVA